MKISITKEELLRSLSVVSKGMSSRSTLPILSGILMATEGDELVFQTTDLEISIRNSTKVFVEEDGAIVVPGKLFSDIVRTLPDAAVSIYSHGEMCVIECLSSRFTLNTLNVADFPRFPEVDAQKEIELAPTQIAHMVHKVSRVVSKDESRAVLTGIYFVVDQEEASFVATDSYRLAVAKACLEKPAVEPFDAIIPGRIFEEVMKSAASEKNLIIGLTENQIVFRFGETIFITRRIEGKYPAYKQLIPSEKNASITVDTADLLAAVKRVSLLAQTHTPLKFSFSTDEQNIEISSQAQEVGGAVETIAAEIVGESVEIGFNHQFIVDGLNSISSKTTLIEVQTSLKPGIFKATDGEDYLYLAMPLRLS